MRSAALIAAFVAAATVAALLAAHVSPGAAGVVVFAFGVALVALAATGRV